VPVTQLEVSIRTEFAEAVRIGLGDPRQKWLPARYFYDDVGSALFEAITALPEYGLTRADARLIEHHATAIVEAAGDPAIIVELGSGSGAKTRWILEAAAARRDRVLYTPIDVSISALAACQSALGSIPGVRITPSPKSYLDGLRDALFRREMRERVLVLFLGSTIGNFERPDAASFLSAARALVEPGDSLLLGTDLLKPARQLIAAYDDPAGVTAAFNRNVLARINRELCGNFDIRSFEHQACFNGKESRIEMHLRSTIPQRVTVEALGQTFSFVENETIWTESSHKFTPLAVREMARKSGFECGEQWIDAEWPFAESLLTAI